MTCSHRLSADQLKYSHRLSADQSECIFSAGGVGLEAGLKSTQVFVVILFDEDRTSRQPISCSITGCDVTACDTGSSITLLWRENLVTSILILCSQLTDDAHYELKVLQLMKG